MLPSSPPLKINSSLYPNEMGIVVRELFSAPNKRHGSIIPLTTSQIRINPPLYATNKYADEFDSVMDDSSRASGAVREKMIIFVATSITRIIPSFAAAKNVVPAALTTAETIADVVNVFYESLLHDITSHKHTVPRDRPVNTVLPDGKKQPQ